MIRPNQLKAGDIIKVTRIYVKDDHYHRGRIWALVIDEGVSAAIIEIFYGPEAVLHEDEFDDGDEGRRCTPSQMPGYACAALAKWRLTGEKTVA